MNENPSPERQPEQERDELGLTADDWADLAIAYNHGLIEPAPGTVEAEVFRRMDAYARQEAARVGQERDREWARSREHRAGAEAQTAAGTQPEAEPEPEIPF